ncbi:hypothetical protein OIU84_016616 [Salix udensis]|uniref:Uncharacterized protein n=1 Tax=Salix udensis TaxID=889485 RepID=A0AAD6JAR5_9ROSI|nr:hypothetical protein OIU84_016616 [Salix udensis]
MDSREDGLKKPDEVSKANMHGPGKKQSRVERGKEKVQDSEQINGRETGAGRRAGNSAMAKPKATTSYAGQRTQVQQREFRTYHEMYKNVTTKNHTPQIQAHISEPPDNEIGIKRGDEMGKEGEAMKVVIEPGEEMRMVEGMSHTEPSETEEEMMVDKGLACTEQSN